MSERFDRVIAAVDAANAEDPETVVVRGARRKKELAHAELMTDWVRRLAPAASEEQLIAARAHHLRRWTVPRATYPAGRGGYLRWRRDRQRQHAEEVASIMRDAGYGEASVAAVQAIIRKERLGIDPAVQVHEDALNLVFLETQAEELAASLGEEKALDVLVRSLAKMSPEGRARIGELEISGAVRALVERALSSAP